MPCAGQVSILIASGKAPFMNLIPADVAVWIAAALDNALTPFVFARGLVDDQFDKKPRQKYRQQKPDQ